jgi:hypothetical protein
MFRPKDCNSYSGRQNGLIDYRGGGDSTDILALGPDRLSGL